MMIFTKGLSNIVVLLIIVIIILGACLIGSTRRYNEKFDAVIQLEDCRNYNMVKGNIVVTFITDKDNKILHMDMFDTSNPEFFLDDPHTKGASVSKSDIKYISLFENRVLSIYGGDPIYMQEITVGSTLNVELTEFSDTKRPRRPVVEGTVTFEVEGYNVIH